MASSSLERGTARALLTAAVLGGFSAVFSAEAAPVVQNFDVNFSSPTESFWGPGQSAADFGVDMFLFGNTTFGMRFRTGASTGTVTSNYNGSISVSYDDHVQLGQGPLGMTIQFAGDAGGAHFDTLLGAFVDVTAYFPVIGGVSVTNPNYSLAAARTYTPSPPDSVFDDDSFTPASSAIGPSVPGGTAQAGIDYDITQNATHSVGPLAGTLRATHQATGQVRSASLSLGSSDAVALDLDLIGAWDVELTNLSLANLFSTDFDLDLVAFAQYVLGFNCGDPATDADNNANFPFTGCLGDGRLDEELVSFDLFSNTPFALAMGLQNPLPTFQVMVAAAPNPASEVPEPAALGLFGLGLAIVGLRRRGPR